MIVFSIRGNVKHLFSILQPIGKKNLVMSYELWVMSYELWILSTEYWLPFWFCFTQRRKGANWLLLLSTHYPHPAAISTRITRIWLIGTDFWNNGYLPARFFSRKDANWLLFLSTHYPHPAAISTRITRIWLICTDFWNNGYLPAQFFSRKDAN